MGVTEPEATFSACFGGAFLMWHPMKYAAMLAEKMKVGGVGVCARGGGGGCGLHHAQRHACRCFGGACLLWHTMECGPCRHNLLRLMVPRVLR